MNSISELLKNTIKNLYGIDFVPDVTPSPENIDADYSSNAPLKLAKELHKSPMEIAKELKESWASAPERSRQETYSDSFSISISAPGFLNFTLSDNYLNSELNNLTTNFTKNLKLDNYKDKTVICEFSDPNPFKVLHVGHLYTSVVGDSISRLFEHSSANVIRANFGGDVGLHVAKTLYALEQKSSSRVLPEVTTEDEGASPVTTGASNPSPERTFCSNQESAPEEESLAISTNPSPERTFCSSFTIEDIANCYVEGTRLYDEDETAKQEITKLNKEIYHINAENIHDGKLAELYWRGRELSYDYFKDFYANIGVEFDKFYPESTVADLGLMKVKENIKPGIYEESNGAIVFKGEPYGLHTRVFINKEGVPTYETKDVGLIFTKDKDYHFDKSVVITGNEQLDYMKVVLKSIEQYAPDLVEKTSHLTHGLVKLPGNVKMSSRKGNFLKAVDVLDLVREELKNAYNSTDEKVVLAAIKYAFLKYKIGGDIIFDPTESVKMTGNSGPYLLYSTVRAKRIVEKIQNDEESKEFLGGSKTWASAPERSRQETSFGSSDECGRELTKLTSFEKDLIKKLLEYKGLLAEAVEDMAPHKVANYLYELSQDFSRFYENCPVAGSEQESERIKIVEAYFKTMSHGLNLLGIEIPEEM